MRDEPTVYVIDEDKTVRWMICVQLKLAGFDVQTYASVEEFLEGYDRGRSGCLVFGVRASGPSRSELQERLAAGRVDIPLIVVDAGNDPAASASNCTGSAADVAIKPCSKELLSARIRGALQEDADRRFPDKPPSGGSRPV